MFIKNISVYAIFNDQSFNDTLTNVIVSFEQLGPENNNNDNNNNNNNKTFSKLKYGETFQDRHTAYTTIWSKDEYILFNKYYERYKRMQAHTLDTLNGIECSRIQAILETMDI